MHTRFIRLTLQGKIMLLLFIITFVSCAFLYWYLQSRINTIGTSYNTSSSLVDAMIIVIFPLLLVGIAGLYVWDILSEPLHHLKTASNEFALGNYGHRLSIQSGDELQELAENYMSMVSTMLHEKRVTIDEKNILSAIFENTAHGVIALDVHATIILANKTACRLLRYLPQEVKGTAFDEIVEFIAFDKKLLFNDLVSLAPEKRSSIKLRTHAGEQKDVAVTLVVLPPSDFLAIRYIVTVADATLHEAEGAVKLDFVSMAAHELRTPLTAIRGYAQLIESNLLKTSDEETKEYVRRLSISCENLANLVDNLLNVTRIERNTLKLEKVPLDAVAIIKSVVRDLKQQAETKLQTLEFIIPESPLPQMLADKYRIIQVITNLVANAINYTPQNGKITITVAQKGSMIETAITDTGIGIPAESLPKLFTKFYRVSGALEEGSKGTGLGLFITKSIITMHSGEITVESERGKGSTFRFTLPIATQQDIEDHDNFIKNAVSSLQRKGLVVNTDRFPGHRS